MRLSHLARGGVFSLFAMSLSWSPPSYLVPDARADEVRSAPGCIVKGVGPVSPQGLLDERLLPVADASHRRLAGHGVSGAHEPETSTQYCAFWSAGSSASWSVTASASDGPLFVTVTW